MERGHWDSTCQISNYSLNAKNKYNEENVICPKCKYLRTCKMKGGRARTLRFYVPQQFGRKCDKRMLSTAVQQADLLRSKRVYLWPDSVDGKWCKQFTRLLSLSSFPWPFWISLWFPMLLFSHAGNYPPGLFTGYINKHRASSCSRELSLCVHAIWNLTKSRYEHVIIIDVIIISTQFDKKTKPVTTQTTNYAIRYINTRAMKIWL